MVNMNGASNSYQPQNPVEKDMKQMGSDLIGGSFSSKSIGRYSEGIPYNSKTNYVSADNAKEQAGKTGRTYLDNDGIFSKNEMTDFATRFGSRSKDYPALQTASKQDIKKAANNIGEMRDEKRLQSMEDAKARKEAQASEPYISPYATKEPEKESKPKYSTDISLGDVWNGEYSLKEYLIGQTTKQNQQMQADIIDAKANGTFKPGKAQERMNKLTD